MSLFKLKLTLGIGCIKVNAVKLGQIRKDIVNLLYAKLARSMVKVKRNGCANIRRTRSVYVSAHLYQDIGCPLMRPLNVLISMLLYMKMIFDALKTEYGLQSSGTTSLLSADGTSLLTDKEAILKRWAENFNCVLNRTSYQRIRDQQTTTGGM